MADGLANVIHREDRTAHECATPTPAFMRFIRAMRIYSRAALRRAYETNVPFSRPSTGSLSSSMDLRNEVLLSWAVLVGIG